MSRRGENNLLERSQGKASHRALAGQDEPPGLAPAQRRSSMALYGRPHRRGFIRFSLLFVTMNLLDPNSTDLVVRRLRYRVQGGPKKFIGVGLGKVEIHEDGAFRNYVSRPYRRDHLASARHNFD